MKISNKSIFYRILCTDQIIAAISLVILVSITFIGVIMRYFFNNPFVWLEEVQLLAFIWVIFWGSPVVVRNGGHVAVDIVVDLMPDSISRVIEILVTIILVAICAFMAYQGFGLIAQHAKSNRMTNILDIPYVYIYLVMPISFILYIVNLSILPFVEKEGEGETNE